MKRAFSGVVFFLLITAAEAVEPSYQLDNVDCRHNPGIFSNPLGPQPLAILAKASSTWGDLLDADTVIRLLNRVRIEAERHCTEVRRRELIRGEVLDHTTVQITSHRNGRTDVAVRGGYRRGQWSVQNNAVKWAADDQRREAAAVERKRREEERKRKEEEQRRALADKAKASRQVFVDFTSRAKIELWPNVGDLRANPYIFRGKIVGVRASFDTMVAENEALFTAGGPIHIAGVPTTRFQHAGMQVLLAARVAGIKQIEMMGTKLPAPHLEYVDTYLCRLSDCEDALFWAKRRSN